MNITCIMILKTILRSFKFSYLFITQTSHIKVYWCGRIINGLLPKVELINMNTYNF